MSCCYVPSCSVPTSSAPTCGVPAYIIPTGSPPTSFPVGGLGSLTSGGGSSGGGSGGGLSGVPASSLGIVAGANVSCINQTPPSEIVIQPAPVMVTLPGAILSASCEPVRVGGYTACGGGSSPCGPRAMISGGSGRLGSSATSRPYICKPC